jgi:hypothetical protein
LLALGTLVMIMFSTFFRSQRATQGVTNLMENRQNARTAGCCWSATCAWPGRGGPDSGRGRYNGSPSIYR